MTEYLDYSGLTLYDQLIKNFVTGETKQLDTKIASNTNKITELSGTVRTNVTNITNLTASATTAKNDINNLKSSANTLETKTNNLQTSAVTLSGRVDNLSSTTRDLRTDVSSLQNVTNGLSTNLNNLSSATQSIDVTHGNALSNLNTDVIGVKSDMTDLQGDMTDLNSQFDTVSSKTEQVCGYTQNLGVDIVDLSSITENLQNQIDALKRETPDTTFVEQAITENTAISGSVPSTKAVWDFSSGIAFISGDTVSTPFDRQFNAFNDTLHVDGKTQTLLPDNAKQARKTLGLGTGDIDTYPTEGSNNVVTSDGVYSAITDTRNLCFDTYDVSKFHRNASGGTAFTLEQAIALVPDEYKNGGLKLSFFSSDFGEYQTWILLSETWDETTSSWGNYKEVGYDDNPEWMMVFTDATDKVLFGIKTDGTVDFALGVPTPIKEYVDNRLFGTLNQLTYNVAVNTSDIDNLKTQTSELYDTKVDKIDGMDLIDNAYFSAMTHLDNPEYLQVTTDNDGKILSGIRSDGSFFAVKSDMQDLIEEVDERLQSELDAKVDKVEGKTLVDNQYASAMTHIDIPEFLQVTTDSDGKILTAIRSDGSVFIAKSDLEDNIIEVDSKIDELEENLPGFSEVDDIEERLEMTIDQGEKLLSYRKKDGTLSEEVGIETPSVKTNYLEVPDTFFDETTGKLKGRFYSTLQSPFQPSYSTSNIYQETFFLSYDERVSSINDVVAIQDYQDTAKNATNRMAISHYYIKSTLTDNGVDANPRYTINENSVRLRHYAHKKKDEPVLVNGTYYFESTLKKGKVVETSVALPSGFTPVSGAKYVKETLYCTSGTTDSNHRVYYHDTLVGSGHMTVSQDRGLYNNEEYSIREQNEMWISGMNTTNRWRNIMTRVVEITGEPCLEAWTKEAFDVDYEYQRYNTDRAKKMEHWCRINVDFGDYYNKNGAYIGVKHQGNSTMGRRKHNYRYTFYKKNDYDKKQKLKFGEMIYMNAYNLKANMYDNTKFKENVVFRVALDVWDSRPITDRYNWDNKINGYYHGATGLIKAFPMQMNVNGDFYGIFAFGYKKDKSNYMISDDGEGAPGVFVAGQHNTSYDWHTDPFATNNYDKYITDDYIMSHYGLELQDEWFTDDLLAMRRFVSYINNQLYIGEDGNEYCFTECNFQDVNSNYWTYDKVWNIEDVFWVRDSLTFNYETSAYTVNDDSIKIQRMYVKDLFWDSAKTIYNRSETTEVNNKRYVTSTLIDHGEGADPRYEATNSSITVVHININVVGEGMFNNVLFTNETAPDHIDVLGFIDYFIVQQVLFPYDNQHNNMLFYMGKDKKKVFPFMYDLDAAMSTSKDYYADVLIPDERTQAEIDAGVQPTGTLSKDVSLWLNIKDMYWNEIVNRYTWLRKNEIITLKHVEDIYNDIIKDIPDNDWSNEFSKWGYGNKVSFHQDVMPWLTKRFEWCDNEYFISN